MTEYVVIVLAAGMGKRMQAVKSKQFILLDNKPIIIHTLEAFESDPWCQRMILVVRAAERNQMEELIKQYPLNKSIQIVDGGEERQDSVYQGLQTLTNTDALILIHDSARPFVEESDIHRLAECASQSQAALLAVPVTDTIKQKKQQQLTTLDRATLWAAQTPQAFSFDWIWRAHLAAREAGVYGTDDGALVELMGLPVEIVEGSYQNIKITTPEDLDRSLHILNSMKNE